MLKLSAALHAAARGDARAVRWRDALQPLADAFVARFLDYLPRAEFPSRAGMHGNSAFALMLALDYAEIVDASALHDAIAARRCNGSRMIAAIRSPTKAAARIFFREDSSKPH